jgi:hypothetical protein
MFAVTIGMFGIRRPFQESVRGAVIDSSGSFSLQINE